VSTGARAVGDGQSGSRADREGLATLSEGGRSRAEGSVGSDDFSGSEVGAVRSCRDSSNGGESKGGHRETHCDVRDLVETKKYYVEVVLWGIKRMAR